MLTSGPKVDRGQKDDGIVVTVSAPPAHGVYLTTDNLMAYVPGALKSLIQVMRVCDGPYVGFSNQVSTASFKGTRSASSWLMSLGSFSYSITSKAISTV